MKIKHAESTPENYKPLVPAELLGQAGELAAASLRQVLRIKRLANCSLKVCFYGLPGCGKTTLANITAAALIDHKLESESINGRDLTIDVVREWQRNSAYGSLFGGWRVKIINEMDLVPMAAQDLLLSYLDTLPNGIAIIGTSNQSRDTLTDRFCSRFQQIKVTTPATDEIAFWLRDRWNIPKRAAHWIALSTCGNVREALLQAAGFLTFGILPEAREKTAVHKPTCAARSDAAKRAWDTMRNNQQKAA